MQDFHWQRHFQCKFPPPSVQLKAKLTKILFVNLDFLFICIPPNKFIYKDKATYRCYTLFLLISSSVII